MGESRSGQVTTSDCQLLTEQPGKDLQTMGYVSGVGVEPWTRSAEGKSKGTLMEYQGIPVGLHPPVALALAKAVERIPDPGALPGPLLYEPKWDGFIHCTLSISGPSAYCPSVSCCRTNQLRLTRAHLSHN